jgi:ribosomal protein S18 acetylase RimI-like enzyme
VAQRGRDPADRRPPLSTPHRPPLARVAPAQLPALEARLTRPLGAALSLHRIDDLPEIAALSRQTFGDEALTPKELRRLYTRAHALVLALRRGPALLGYTVLELNRRQRRIYVVETCTHPHARGGGLAAHLRACVVELAHQLGYRTIASHTRLSNQPAQRLNLRAGMALIGQIDDYYEDGEAALYFKRSL